MFVPDGIAEVFNSRHRSVTICSFRAFLGRRMRAPKQQLFRTLCAVYPDSVSFCLALSFVIVLHPSSFLDILLHLLVVYYYFLSFFCDIHICCKVKNWSSVCPFKVENWSIVLFLLFSKISFSLQEEDIQKREQHKNIFVNLINGPIMLHNILGPIFNFNVDQY